MFGVYIKQNSPDKPDIQHFASVLGPPVKIKDQQYNAMGQDLLTSNVHYIYAKDK